MRVRILTLILGLILITAAISSADAQESTELMPDEIITMHRNGRSDTQIITEIQSRGINFEVNLPVLERMIQAGVSQAVLEVLLGYDPSRRIQQKTTMRFSGPTAPGVAVITQPPGLNLFIDGKEVGVTPSLSNKLKPGKHVIRVDHPLYFSRQEEINFDGENDIVLNWLLEPREPVIRVSVSIERGDSSEPWSWIIRPRSQCPGCDVSLELKPWKPMASAGEAVFLLDDASKRLFRGNGTACLELNIWRGEVRRDLPLRRLPPPTVRYFITDVRIDGIQTVDLAVDVEIKQLNVMDPEVNLKGMTGYLIQSELSSEEKQKKKTYEEMIETLDGVIQ
ncbi:MAG TPA: PEGA domain-containing protein [bacterium]|nr:PEGA domain-containing protein [bacterium]